VLLHSGKVLVAGGDAHGFGVFPAELYDPITGMWSRTGSMNWPEQNQKATLMPSGKVLVSGGVHPELYDPDTGTWDPTPTSPLVPHEDSTATLLASGKVLVAGGSGSTKENMDLAELYDPDTGLWLSTQPMQEGRFFHTATLLRSGKVLVVGGWTEEEGGKIKVLASAELYDPNTDTWTLTGSMAQARIEHTATLLPSGKVLVVGCAYLEAPCPTELYDPDTGTWSITGSPITARGFHAATLLPSGKVLMVGGSNGTILSEAELYDPDTGTWTSAGTMASARYSSTATLLPWGSVLVTGGINLDSAELYLAEARNQPPAAKPLEATTPENTPVAVTLDGLDLLGDSLTYSVVTSPKHGTLTGAPPNLLYTPHRYFHGSDSFTYKVSDGSFDSEVSTVSLTVTPVNSPPQAFPLTLTTSQDTSVAVTLSGLDPEGDALTFTLVTHPSHGELLGEAPNLTFVPQTGYGSDSFTYRVSDGALESEGATVSIQVLQRTEGGGCTSGGCTSMGVGANSWLALIALSLGLGCRTRRRERLPTQD
jgi:hypothetical protein